MATRISTNSLPLVIEFSDYHEIDDAGRVVRCFDKNIGSEEVTNPEGELCYWGLFWLKGNKPTKTQVRALVEKAIESGAVKL